MIQDQGLSGTQLGDLLRRAKAESAHASIRAVGSTRMLGDLQVRGLEPGTAVQLMGVKRREQFPNPGAEVIVSILLGDVVISSRTTLLEPILHVEGDTLFPPVLRVAWPTHAIQTHRRQEVRVATADLPSLEAVLDCEGRRVAVRLLNLTETGMGLGLDHELDLPVKTLVHVETQVPGGGAIRVAGELRHAEMLEGEPHPMRLGVVLGPLEDGVRDTLHRFIQARRMDRSEELRRTH
jgi:c-di-GMP-binding flagellar brake protein YcgR